MHRSLWQQKIKQAKDEEDYWFKRHKEATNDKDLNDYGWLWMHCRELRVKLETLADA